MATEKKLQAIPEAINEGGYTYSLEGTFNSPQEARCRFRELLRDKLPDDAKYRIKRFGDRYGLYTW